MFSNDQEGYDGLTVVAAIRVVVAKVDPDGTAPTVARRRVVAATRIAKSSTLSVPPAASAVKLYADFARDRKDLLQTRRQRFEDGAPLPVHCRPTAGRQRLP